MLHSLSVRSLILFYFLFILLYTFISFGLTDPNLVLSTWAPYWKFQQWMWETFFNNSGLMSQVFTVAFLGLIATYTMLVTKLSQVSSLSPKFLICTLCLLSLPLLLSYNSLS
ncbi:MAG: hypothetical protein M3Q81_05770, partial [bacterium]|nr:hypothetical protein [bacterium]